MSEKLFTVTVEEHFAIPSILEQTAKATKGMVPAVALEHRSELLEMGAKRIEDMDALGVDVQVISHNAPGPEWLKKSEGAALTREANDVLLAAIAAHPDRYAGFAALPVTDPSAMAGELERAVAGGLVGGMVSGISGGFLDDERFGDLLAKAEELDVPIYVHPGLPPQAIKDIYYSGVSKEIDTLLATAAWGWHSETAITVLRMILAGVFDRHPRLNIIIGHLGEMLPAMVSRAGALLDKTAGLERPLRDYFPDNVYITTAGVFDHHAFRSATDLVGIDRMMFAMDYPFTPGNVGNWFLRHHRLDPSDRRKIAGENAARILRLRDASPGADMGA